MSGTKTVVTAMIMTPIQSHPSATVIDPLVKKIACVIAAPALPPAPTKPEANSGVDEIETQLAARRTLALSFFPARRSSA